MLEAKVMRPNLAKSKSASDNRKLAAILGHLGTNYSMLAQSMWSLRHISLTCFR
jgi:hypothetical protein